MKASTAKKPTAKRNYVLSIRSRHPSHEVLRKKLRFPYRVLYRLGSLTELDETAYKVVLNNVKSIETSNNKKLMKLAFFNKQVSSPNFIFVNKLQNTLILTKHSNGQCEDIIEKDIDNVIQFPLIKKPFIGSGGEGHVKIDNKESLLEFLKSNPKVNYYFEEFFKNSREYRIHVSPYLGEIFSVRKMLKQEAKENGAFSRNIATGDAYFVREFDKPEEWEAMVNESIKAAQAVGLDIAAIDIMYSVKTKQFMICETNSAPSLGDITAETYLSVLPTIVENKLKSNEN